MGKRELIGSYRDLDVYKMAMDCAIRIFESTKSFPLEERFRNMDEHYDQIIGKLVRMIANPRPWLPARRAYSPEG